MKVFFTVLLVLCFAGSTFAQIHLPLVKKDKDKDFQTHDPDEVADTLRSGGDEKRNSLAVELAIMAPNDSNPTAKSGAACTNFEHVDERQTHLRAGADNAVIIADSSQCDSTYLIVFDRGQKESWKHVQTVRLPARVQRPEITFAELIQPGVSEIVIHRETTHQGGAADQENFLVLKMLHDRMIPVLDTIEQLSVTLPDRPENDGDNVQQSQQSTFELLKADPTSSAAATRILEKEVIQEKKTSVTRYFSWDWDPEMERYRPAPSDGTDVAQWRPLKQPPKRTASAPAKNGTNPEPPK